MKNKLTFFFLPVITFLFVNALYAQPQIFLYGSTQLSPPIGRSCNAVVFHGSNHGAAVGVVNIPFPSGLKFSDIHTIQTDYTHEGWEGYGLIHIMVNMMHNTYGLVSIDVPVDNYYLYNWDWASSNNVMNDAAEYDIYPFGPSTVADLKAQLGNADIREILVLFSNADNNYYIDNFQLNNIVYTFDDCNQDGVISPYDCDDTDPRNTKWQVCHNGTIHCFAYNAMLAHLSHGDFAGGCFEYAAIQRQTALIQDNVEEIKFNIFPNSVSSKGIIHVELPVSSKINVSLYDIQGRLAATILNGQKQAGVHDFSFDVSKLNAGLLLPDYHR